MPPTEFTSAAPLDRLLDIGRTGWTDRGMSTLNRLRPVTASPGGPLETFAALDSFAPSLMPRSSLHQGVVTGLSVLAARSVSSFVERATNRLVSADSPLAVRLVARGIVGGAGYALEQLPAHPNEPTYRASARTVGRLLSRGAIGGALYDVGKTLDDTLTSTERGRFRSAVVGVGAVGMSAAWMQRNLKRRKAEIEASPKPQKLTLPASIAASAAVMTVGSGISWAFCETRDGLLGYLGPGPSKQVIGRGVNMAAWAGIGTAAYWAMISKVGRANEKIDPGYSDPPSTERVSGTATSEVTWDDLGQQGRRFVTDVVTGDLVGEVMGEPAQAEPIRVFVGYNAEPLYFSGRAELALQELERTGAFDRSHLLLVCPTGTGWVDHTMIEAAEFFARGDIATCCIQFGRYPSFLSVQKVQQGVRQFRLLLWGVKQRLAERPPDRRPRVLVFGESLGAWASSDVVMYQGIAGFDHYGIDKALWVGLPAMAKWSKEGMSSNPDQAPPGTCGVFDRPEQLEALSDDERKFMRAFILSHDNDPIAALNLPLAVKKPGWMGKERGRNVPPDARWVPIITFLQTAIDAANAMVNVPGMFRSFGHDYRADMASFVRGAFDFDATDAQLASVDEALRRLEVERADRTKKPTDGEASAETAANSPQKAAELLEAGVPVHHLKHKEH